MFDQVRPASTGLGASNMAPLVQLIWYDSQVLGLSPAWPRAVAAGQGAGIISNTLSGVGLTMSGVVGPPWQSGTLGGMGPCKVPCPHPL